ncbi:hypothetical protein Golax_025388, partial [Gossypium laxum]|nr:hypothetical protein [Gossypium laxum]
MIGSPLLSAVKEVKEHLRKNIDRCYNDLSYDQTQSEIDLITKAQDLLQQEIYQLWTDGRRILAYYTGNIEKDRDEEPLRLLKKLAEMKIEDFPSHILEENRNTWLKRRPRGKIEKQLEKKGIHMQTKKIATWNYHQINDVESNDENNHDVMKATIKDVINDGNKPLKITGYLM